MLVIKCQNAPVLIPSVGEGDGVVDNGVDPTWAPPTGSPSPDSGPPVMGVTPLPLNTAQSQRRRGWQGPPMVISLAVVFIALIAVISFAVAHMHRAGPGTGIQAGAGGADTSTPADWAGGVCGPLAEDRVSPKPRLLRNASAEHFCELLGPGSAEDNISFFFAEYSDQDQMRADIATFSRLMFPVFAYAAKDTGSGQVWLALAQGNGEDPPDSVRRNAEARIASLDQFGFQSDSPSTPSSGGSSTTSTIQSPAAAAVPSGACGQKQAAAVAQGLSQLSIEPQTGARWSGTPIDSNFDPCAELSTVLVTVEGATGGSPVQALMFHRGDYLGTGTARAYGFTSVDHAASTADTVVLRYLTGQSCAAWDDGHTTTVRYHWDGTQVQMLDPPPPG